MTNISTQKPIRVLTDTVAGSYINLRLDQVEKVRELFEANAIAHWVDHSAISVDGCPFVTVIHPRRKADPIRAQEILDAV